MQYGCITATDSSNVFWHQKYNRMFSILRKLYFICTVKITKEQNKSAFLGSCLMSRLSATEEFKQTEAIMFTQSWSY